MRRSLSGSKLAAPASGRAWSRAYWNAPSAPLLNAAVAASYAPLLAALPAGGCAPTYRGVPIAALADTKPLGLRCEKPVNPLGRSCAMLYAFQSIGHQYSTWDRGEARPHSCSISNSS